MVKHVVVPATEPAGALTTTTEKGRPARGWRCTTTMTLVIVPVRAPTAKVSVAPEAALEGVEVAWMTTGIIGVGYEGARSMPTGAPTATATPAAMAVPSSMVATASGRPVRG
jgi:hypothetical protein